MQTTTTKSNKQHINIVKNDQQRIQRQKTQYIKTT